MIRKTYVAVAANNSWFRGRARIHISAANNITDTSMMQIFDLLLVSYLNSRIRGHTRVNTMNKTANTSVRSLMRSLETSWMYGSLVLSRWAFVENIRLCRQLHVFGVRWTDTFRTLTVFVGIEPNNLSKKTSNRESCSSVRTMKSSEGFRYRISRFTMGLSFQR